MLRATPMGLLPAKPSKGDACNGCGYCCSAAPCELAEQFLNCTVGPCVALEHSEGRTLCGLARNPLGYLFKAAHPGEEVALLDAAPAIPAGQELSAQIAQALGIGKGCDADDDGESAAWPFANAS